jgi:hypothetical protein
MVGFSHQNRAAASPFASNSHFDPERGCVVPASRSVFIQNQAFRRIHALRLVLRTQPRSAK